MTTLESLKARAIAMPHTPEWHEERGRGIGSSEIAAIVGFDEYATALDLYRRKTGIEPPFEGNRSTRLGNALEPAIVDEYCRETGRTAAMYPCPLMAHPDLSFARATPDCILEPAHAGEPELLECKTSNLRMIKAWGESETDFVPDRYLCQAQWQLAITGLQVCRVAVLVAADELRTYTVLREDKLVEMLLEQAAEFWHRVKHQEPPDPDWDHRHTPELIRGMYGAIADKEVIDLSRDAAEAWRDAEKIGKQIGELKQQQETLKAKAMWEIGEYSGGRLGDGRFVKKNIVKRAAYTVDAGSYTTWTACKIDQPKAKKAKAR